MKTLLRHKEVFAAGAGFNGTYQFVREVSRYDSGWALIEPGGSYLTPGIGKPMRYETPEELLDAIRANRPGIKLVIRERP